MISVLGVFNADLKFMVENFPKAGETLHGLSFEVQPGGKGFNQAVACRRAQGNDAFDVVMLTQLGEDNFADMAREVMANEGIDASNVLSSSKMPTGTAMIMVEEQSAENMIVISPGAASLLGKKEVLGFSDNISNSKIFMTNLEVPMEVAMEGLEIAHQNGVKTLLDPAPACDLPDEIYQHLDFITPNESEAAILLGFEVNTLEDAERAGKMLCSRGVTMSIITMGGLGVMAVSHEKTTHCPAFKLNDIVDTTGAGDAFNGCFVASIAEGNNLDDALRFASAGAALCVKKYGAADAMPDRNAIDNFLRNSDQ